MVVLFVLCLGVRNFCAVCTLCMFSPFSLMCSLLLKDLSFNFYLLLLQLVLRLVAAIKSLFVHHPYMQVIFSFWSFEISEDILRNQKFIIGKDSKSEIYYR